MVTHQLASPREPAPLPPWLADTSQIAPLPAITRPTLRLALPDGRQRSLPGTQWPNRRIWELAEQPAERPPLEIRQIKRAQSNPLIIDWGTHDLGAETRRYGYTAFALYVLGHPIAVATAATSHSKSVDQDHGLRRTNVIELTRLCRAEEPLAAASLRIMLRAWREFLATQYWTYNDKEEVIALITYSMPGKAGHIYRADGWVKLRDCKPWGGASNWSNPSRTGSKPGALWVYWLPAHRRLPAQPKRRQSRRHSEQLTLAASA